MSFSRAVSLLLRHHWIAASLALFALASCGDRAEEGGPKLPRLPEGVKTDFKDPHCPDPIYLRDEGGKILIQVDVPLLTRPEHHIRFVRIVAPMPGFKELDSYTYTQEDMEKGANKPWSHLFEIPRARLPEGLASVLVISHCDLHGEFGVLQAVLNLGLGK